MNVTAAAAAGRCSSGSGGCSHKVDPNEADEVIEGILRPIVQLPEVKLAPVSSVYTRVPLANCRHFVRQFFVEEQRVAILVLSFEDFAYPVNPPPVPKEKENYSEN